MLDPGIVIAAISSVTAIAVTDTGKKLVEVFAAATGAISRPLLISRLEINEQRRRAMAELEIEIESADLRQRAEHARMVQAIINQANIEFILLGAQQSILPDAKPENIDADWMRNFFEESKLTSSEEMQHLWSRVLAEEASAQGSFSIRTLKILSSLSRPEGLLFQRVCCLKWNNHQPAYPESTDALDLRLGLAWAEIQDLTTTGLVVALDIPTVQELPEGNTPMQYFDKMVYVRPGETMRWMTMCNIYLTKEGRELSRIVDVQPIAEVFDQCLHHWVETDQLVVFSPFPKFDSAAS